MKILSINVSAHVQLFRASCLELVQVSTLYIFTNVKSTHEWTDYIHWLNDGG